MSIYLTFEYARSLRAAEIAMLIKLDPNWLFTFNFGFRVDADKARKLVAWWFNAAQRTLYGSTWTSQFDRSWPEVHCYFEHPDSNPHYHGLASIPDRMGYWTEAHGNELWRKVVRSGQLDIREVHNVRGIARYCTKDFIRRRGFEQKFVYKDTRLATIGVSSLVPGKES